MGSPDPTTWLHFVRDFARTLGHEELSDSSQRPMRSQALGGWASVRWRGVFFRRIVKLGSAGQSGAHDSSRNFYAQLHRAPRRLGLECGLRWWRIDSRLTGNCRLMEMRCSRCDSICGPRISVHRGLTFTKRRSRWPNGGRAEAVWRSRSVSIIVPGTAICRHR